MNQHKILSERQDAAKICLAEELDKLVNGSCNPFVRVRKGVDSMAVLTKETTIMEASCSINGDNTYFIFLKK